MNTPSLIGRVKIIRCRFLEIFHFRIPGFEWTQEQKKAMVIRIRKIPVFLRVKYLQVFERISIEVECMAVSVRRIKISHEVSYGFDTR